MAISVEMDALALFDFQLSQNWDFYIVDSFNASGFIPGVIESANLLGGFALKLLVKDTTLNLPKFEAVQDSVGGKHYSAVSFSDEFSVTAYETSVFSTYRYFKAWMNDVYDFKQRMFKPDTYGTKTNRTGVITFYRPKTLLESLDPSLENTPNNISAVFILDDLKILGIESPSLAAEGGGAFFTTASLTAGNIYPVEELDF